MTAPVRGSCFWIAAAAAATLGCGVWPRVIGSAAPSPSDAPAPPVAMTPAPAAEDQAAPLLAAATAAPGATAAPAATAQRTPRPAQPGDPYSEALAQAYRSFRDLGEGKNADFVPSLAKVDPRLYGLAIVTVAGTTYEVGASRDQMPITSVSKPFTLARAIETAGADVVRDRVGVNATGQRMDSILAIELARNMSTDKGHGQPAGNPLVNAGAIAVVDLVPAAAGMDKWTTILMNLGAFAGRQLVVNEEVYRAASEINARDRAITSLLASYEVLKGSPQEALDLYTRQCSVSVNARDLAVMGATLANGGRNPITGALVVSPATAAKVLAVASTAGLDQSSGEWMYAIGVPAQSGAGGGIVAVVPGRYAIGTFSPPLDETGTSVRGMRAVASIVGRLGGNLFAARPAASGHRADAPPAAEPASKPISTAR